jgi:hypothetical protein
MDKGTSPSETLKQILRQIRNPDLLNEHPWTRSLIVQEMLASQPHLAGVSPGQQLVHAIAGLFPQLQPPQPPRRGKRLDPRWGEFGLLAALYFAPLNNGKAFPKSLTDAWSRIDRAILEFVYQKPVDALGAQDIQRYELVGADFDYGAASTLSDWHKKGLQRLTEIILNRERFLCSRVSEPSILLQPQKVPPTPASEVPGAISSPKAKRWLAISLFILLLGLVASGIWKARNIYFDARAVYHDVIRLEELVRAPVEIEDLHAGAPVLKSLQGNLAALRKETGPLLWLAPYLDWVPGYGQDLAASPALLDLAEHLTRATVLSYEAAGPLLGELGAQGSSLEPAGLTLMLVEAQPSLLEARGELDQALAARQAIPAGNLSPRLSGLVVGELDPLLHLADEGLALATALPAILGAADDGPKTYMLLPQNEDELRPTGGFITSVGNLVLHKGEVISLTFESVDNEQEDWTLPYPSAPWQLREYMNSRVLILRDANWFADFPTTAQWVEYLYAYTHSHSVDGIIAFDQHFLVMLLGHLGPLNVEVAPYPITEENVIQYMRQAKRPPAGKTAPADWYRKEFIGKLAGAVLSKLTSGDQYDWQGVATVLSQALAQRHLLLQFDDPTVARLIAARGWDYAVRAEQNDYLLVTDTNIGFNKTNAVVDVGLSYDVDLNDLGAPVGTLVVLHKNNAAAEVPCIHWNTGQITTEPGYPINRCYWSYLRVYKQQDVKLMEARPHLIQGEWMIRGEDVPPRVDVLDEDLPGVQAFGTLLVVKGGASLSTSFEFGLPPGVVAFEDSSGRYTYRLKVQKQPGTLAIPLTLRIHLPNRAALISAPGGAFTQDNSLLVEADLRTDLELEIVFRLP